MGSVLTRTFKRNDAVDGQGKATLLFAKRISLQKYELDRIFHEFSKYESPSSHLVSWSDVFRANKVEFSIFSSVLFQIFDRYKVGLVNFLEYLQIMWSFLSTDEDNLARMCFELFDIRKKGTLDVDEVKYLIHTIWSFGSLSKTCVAAVRRIDQNQDGIYTKDEFVLLAKHFYDILQPIRKIRNKLRKRTVYTRFWKQLMNRRSHIFGSVSFFEICDRTDAQYVVSSMDYLNLRRDVVPSEFTEQWNYTQQRKSTRGTLHVELPYEIREILQPHPMNPTVKKMKGIGTITKALGIFSRNRAKARLAIDNQHNHFDDLDGDSVEKVAHDEHMKDSTAERKEDNDLEAGNERPAKPFDDSYLGSLKAGHMPSAKKMAMGPHYTS